MQDVEAMGDGMSKGEGCAALLLVLLLVPVGFLIGFVLYLFLIVSCPEVEPLGKLPFTGEGGLLCAKTSNPVAWAVFIASCAALVAGWFAVVWFVPSEFGAKTDAGLGSTPRPRR